MQCYRIPAVNLLQSTLVTRLTHVIACFLRFFRAAKFFFFLALDLSAHVHSVVALVLAMMHLVLPKRRRPFLFW